MTVRILNGDCRDMLRTLADGSVHCVVTSPPYWGLRDYGVEGQIGLEATPQEFLARLVEVFEEVRRVLRADGTLWLNLGDSYAGSGRGGNATAETSTLEGGLSSQEASVRKPRGKGEIGASARDAAITNFGRRATLGSQLPAGLKQKDLVGIPWLVAFALREAGWWLRQDIIWSKPNPMPESVTDRCTKAHEYLFLLSKNAGNPLLWRHDDGRLSYAPPEPDYYWRHRKTGALSAEVQDGEEWLRLNRWAGCDYYFDQDAILEPISAASVERLSQPTIAAQNGSNRVPGKSNGPMKAVSRNNGNKARVPATERGCPNDGVAGHIPWEGYQRNKRSVWTVATQPFKEAHFATFPPDLIEPCILAGCPEGGTVLDPFGGSGTTGLVADRLGRNAILIELNPEYAAMARRRIEGDAPLFAEVDT